MSPEFAFGLEIFEVITRLAKAQIQRKQTLIIVTSHAGTQQKLLLFDESHYV